MIKNVPTFSEMELSSLIFLLSFKRELSKLEKIKKIHPGKYSLYLEKWNFIALILNNSYISGNGNPKKNLYISEEGAFLYFRKYFSELEK